MHLYGKFWLWLIGFTLVYCVGVNERENQISGEKMFQTNIYYYASIECVLCISGKDVQRRTKKSCKSCQTNQGSCACTRFLFMHNTLVHAQHSCACTGGARAQGPDPKRALAQAGAPAIFLGQNLVHAQESCACTRFWHVLTFFDFLSTPTFWPGIHPGTFGRVLGASWTL